MSSRAPSRWDSPAGMSGSRRDGRHRVLDRGERFEASLLPEGMCTPGTEAFPRAVTDSPQRCYAAIGGHLAIVSAVGRIELAWEPAVTADLLQLERVHHVAPP